MPIMHQPYQVTCYNYRPATLVQLEGYSVGCLARITVSLFRAIRDSDPGDRNDRKRITIKFFQVQGQII